MVLLQVFTIVSFCFHATQDWAWADNGIMKTIDNNKLLIVAL
jgi:hypothetical protein